MKNKILNLIIYLNVNPVLLLAILHFNSILKMKYSSFTKKEFSVLFCFFFKLFLFCWHYFKILHPNVLLLQVYFMIISGSNFVA